MTQFIIGSIRVQLLREDIVRIEYGKGGAFCDEDTFLIPNRSGYAATTVPAAEAEGVICFGEYELYIPPQAGGLAGVRLEKNGRRVYTCKRLKNSGELPPIDKTPEVFALADTPRILVPRGGYSASRTGEYKVADAQDIYLFLCQKDCKKLRRLYVGLTGRCELVRLSTLGGWNSKYYEYDEKTAEQVILDYARYGLPLDNMVIDTDWRAASERGIGYDVNKALFPDIGRFFAFAHAHGVEIMFNDHPEPVEGCRSVFSPREIRYREKKLQALLAAGLDTWWYDRNWSTKLKSPHKGIHPETLGLYLFRDITFHFYQKQAGNTQICRRPVIMGNADNVANGEYRGIASSASHRYSIQWTGDIGSEAESLAEEIRTLLRAGDNCIAYIHADCGGHTGSPGKELFVRWMQFGVFSPVFRPHCTKNVPRTREPWLYDGETLDIVREYSKLRYRLLPVLYAAARSAYDTGAPLFKRLGWEYPQDRRAAVCADEYMLGDLLIAPVAGEPLRVAARKHFLAPVKAVYYNGTALEGEPLCRAEYDTLHMALDGAPPEKGVPVCYFSARFETTVRFEEDVELYLRSDDGATVWLDGEKVLEDKTMHSAVNFPLGRVRGGVPHTLKVEYFQAGGEACCSLLYGMPRAEDDVRAVYLPAGRWLDLFGGRVYAGGRKVRRAYGLREMPLFVRLGALLPLAYDAKNTKEQKWSRLVYDFYPDREGRAEGVLYEDDGETTAYRCGQFRTSAYEGAFDGEKNAFVVKLHAAEGAFAGERACAVRQVMVKYHLLKGAEKVQKVLLNGREAAFSKTGKDAAAFPLGTGAAAPEGAALTVTFAADVYREYTVEFFLR